jgi:hypothetical protein
VNKNINFDSITRQRITSARNDSNSLNFAQNFMEKDYHLTVPSARIFDTLCNSAQYSKAPNSINKRSSRNSGTETQTNSRKDPFEFNPQLAY